MKNLVNEIVTYLKTLEMPYTMTIRDTYNKKAPSYPLLVVGEVQNATRMALIGEERLSDLGHQIDIFSNDRIVDGTPTSGAVICRDIAEVVDEKLQEKFGMTRQSFVELPDVNDETVSRITLRYNGILDIKTDVMYR